jgi:hypothetical protein
MLKQRSSWILVLVFLCSVLCGPMASAKSKLSALDAGQGIKEALAQGVQSSISQLGRENGFLQDQAVRILLPDKLQKLAETARKLGAAKYVDELELSMNRAAEKAVPVAADVFADAVRQMSVTDALGIVSGGSDAGTQYFKRVASERLRSKFLPIVADATAESGVARRYEKLNKKAGGLGKLLSGSSGSGEAPDLNGYITEKAMDGLFYYIAEKERAIRANPLQQNTDLLRRVFSRK